MNKHIIAILLTTFTTSVFSADHMLINGKKVTMNDTRSTLIQKFGQPESGTAQFSNWTIGNLSLYANYQKQGLAQFSVNQLSTSPSKHLINIDGKAVYLGKDTIKTATSKFKHACFNFDEGRQGSTYTMTPKTAVKNKLNIVLETTGDAYDVKSISNLPINGFSFTQDAVASNSGCK
ncbi:hypothetical protein N5I15_12750 [Acinetobacter johnsonii]|uniref:hypothetical protein n=1 Tax=Acinetobacter johnsonii TaxID=40214 RepID=UPI002448B4D1|nr:hypothetical protein [Acinetobacter johnsonii]MDH1533214.1 hypothetical protein [Acinetobacter johnsonii]